MIIKYFTLPFNKVENQIKTKVSIMYNNKNVLVDALWDTGASGSCISYDVVKNLGLMPISKVPIQTPSGFDVYNGFIVDVELPNNILLKDVMVCDSKIGDQNIGMLVGMNIISKGDMAISNFNNRTIFSYRYPSCEDINFVAEARMKDLIQKNKHGKGKRKK